jgi:FHA domain-containing protein
VASSDASSRVTERREKIAKDLSPAARAMNSFESSLELPCWMTEIGEGFAESAFQLVLIKEGVPVARQLCAYDDLVIGRSPGCGLVLEDAAASRLHARVVSGAIVDEDSANGTRVNGLPIRRRELEDGDVISIGAYELVYHTAEGGLPEEQAEAPPASGSGVGHISMGDMTLRMGGKKKKEKAQVEVPRRGYLFLGGDTSSVQRKGVQMTVSKDVFVVGAVEGADLSLKSFRMPPVVALILRGRAGFTLVPFGRWPHKVELDGRAVTEPVPLEDKDKVLIGKLELIFRHGSS